MATPVLVTAGVLTAGWLLLSRERANSIPPRGGPPDVKPETVGQTDEEFSDSNPGTPTVREHGEQVLPPPGNDPSTTPDHAPAATVIGQAHTLAADDATPMPVSATQTYWQAWGVSADQLNGTSKAQQADIIQTYGGAMGAVW